MGRPKIDLLTDEELESIHLASLDILEHVGVYLPLKEVLDILAQKGAQVDYAKSLAKIPSKIVEEYVHKAPSEFTLCARNAKFNMTLKPGSTHFVTGSGATRFVDIESNIPREAALDDLIQLIKIADALENFSGIGELVVPGDVPPDLSPHYIWASLLKNSRKHIMMYLNNASCVRDAVRMASCVVGSEGETLATRPLIDFTACIGSPLAYEKQFLEGFVEVANRRIPLLVESGVMAGATGPVTLAGTMALCNAEILSGITIAQAISPGMPVVYSNWCRIFDMKAGNASLASPEYALMRIGVAELVQRYYKIPINQGGFTTDSKVLDAQTGYEKYIALISSLAGTNLVLGGELDGGSLMDPLGWVIVDELAYSYLRIMDGLRVDEDSLALDIIRAVGPGPGHNFLATEHSRKNLRREHWLDYAVTERRTFGAWARDGAKDARQRAREKLKAILEKYQPEPLSVDVQDELDRIVKEAGKRLLT
jgi:trimethylamine--corrinoid protein Co-methyltransferase